MIGAVLGLALGASAGLDASVQLRSGYDSNIFSGAVQALADPLADRATEGQSVASDAFVMVHPGLEGALGAGRFRFGASYDYLLTQFGEYAHGDFQVHRATLDQGLQLGAVALGLFEQGEDFAISAFRSDHLERGLVGATAGTLVGPLDLGLRLELGLRHFPQREIAPQVVEDDHQFAAVAVARWNLGAAALDASARVERRESNSRALDGDVQQLGVGGTWGRGSLQLGAQAAMWRVALARFPITDTTSGREDVQLGAHATAGWRWGAFTPGIDLGYERNFSNYDPGAFKRFVVAASVLAQWGTQRGATTPAVVSLPSGRYRLQVFLPGATHVSVVGSFQGWKQPGIPLVEESPGHFAVELPLPPGRHRYQLVVDGAVQTPPDAEGYEPDMLGGQDGVITVPGASNPGDGR